MRARHVTILPLQDAPDAMSLCARWLNDEWGKAYGYGLRDTADWLREIMAPGSGEAALVALDGGSAVGICLLVACDLESRAELTPWVSGLFVQPDRRRRSIGSKLLSAVEGTARAAGAGPSLSRTGYRQGRKAGEKPGPRPRIATKAVD